MEKYKLVIENPINAYILDKEENTIVAICNTKRPDLEFDKLKELIRQSNEFRQLNNGLKLVLSENDMLTQNNEKLLSKNLIYKNFAIELLDKMLDEFNKDGWCRLAMKKEDVLRFKERLKLK